MELAVLFIFVIKPIVLYQKGWFGMSMFCRFVLVLMFRSPSSIDDIKWKKSYCKCPFEKCD